jgi:hypothetical protein
MSDAPGAPIPYLVAILLWLGSVVALVVRKLVS